MQKATLTSSWIATRFSFISHVSIGSIHSDDANTNRISPALSEFDDLVSQIIDHPIDLLDHRFRQDFYLDSDLHRRDHSPRHAISVIDDRSFTGYNLPERPISPASLHTMPFIRDIQYAPSLLDVTLQLR